MDRTKIREAENDLKLWLYACEYCIQVANPCLKIDNYLLEEVQRTATKFPYDVPLAKLNLFPLSYRRNKGELTTIFKLVSDISSLFLSFKTENLQERS